MDKDTIIDSSQTPLNACSLEVLQSGFKVISGCELEEEDGHVNSIITHHPLVIGCYQLNENSSGGTNVDTIDKNEKEEGDESSSATRSGALLLHMIPSSLSTTTTNNNNNGDNNQHSSSHLKFDKPTQLMNTSSGILDGKWLQHSSIFAPKETLSERINPRSYLYATACASGFIEIYQFRQHNITNDNPEIPIFELSLITSSGNSSSDDHGLALSLAWDESVNITNNTSTRIVSSYSKGSIAIHNVNLDNTCIEETYRWDAHTLFGCAAEVWTVCFASNAHYSTYADNVISGGDDCKMKIWDLRSSCHKPIHCIGDEEFGAGVTTVSYHPSLEHVFCSGSYDESIRFWDMRKLDGGEPLARIHVGGGVWRAKWHPMLIERLLVAAMHGGCRIVDIPSLDGRSDCEPEIVRKFVGHKSMAYGADWIYLDGHYEASASCSFYDRQAFIW
jgi:diphthamide biosynthesis protein 7